MNMVFSNEDIETILEATVLRQGKALHDLFYSLDRTTFFRAVEYLRQSEYIFTLGVGKSGHIAGKIADTLCSIGSPAFFLSAEQLLHGGMSVLHRDALCLLLISKSGETQELLDIVNAIEYNSISKILISGRENSPLAKLSDVSIIYTCDECCGQNFLPTTSTTISLAIGDALAVALMKENNLTVKQFAQYHPGGSLGVRLRENIGKREFPNGS